MVLYLILVEYSMKGIKPTSLQSTQKKSRIFF